MKVFWKLLAAVIVLAIVLSVFYFDSIRRLWKVNSLFEPDKIVHNFSNMQDALFNAPLPAPEDTHVWPENPAQLPGTVTVSGTQVDLSDFLTEMSTTALLVIQDGEIKFENYYQGTTIDDRRISWSVAKSFLSAIFGVAVEKGDIKSIDDLVINYVPELKGSAYETATIRNVLNMSSGVKFNEDYYQKDSDINKMGRVLALGGSMDDFAAELKEQQRPAGTARQYVSIDTHVVGLVLRNATGQSATEYFMENLWSKIEPGKDAFYLTDGEGVAFVLGGLNMRTRDYALFGQLMLQNGRWKGEQIIPARWVKQSTKVSAPAPEQDDGFGYGFQWWIPKGSKGEYMASGIYGQQIFVDPNANMVIVKNGAHIDFNRQSPRGRHYKLETVDMFRSIAEYYSSN